MRMFKLIKVLKNRDNIIRHLGKVMKVNVGYERFLFIVLVILMVNHISACLWITIASLENDGDSARFSNTWAKGYAGSTSSQLYIVSFYWATTTITTVGYGDISGTTDIERIFCTIIMLFGVIAFSFANGSLTSIIQNIDSNNALFE